MSTLEAPHRSATHQLDVLDPATGDVVGAIPAGSAEAADRAVRRARVAQPDWARTAPAERAAILKAGARRLRERARDLAELQTQEGGKPLADSLGGVEAGIGAIEQYAELGPLHRGRSLQGAWETTDLMVHEPRGVVALLVPWNDPVAIACGQIAAALVTGNTVVYKPSEKTPLSAALLVELLDVPGDALVLLQGDGRAGRPLAAHEGVALVVHTGSVQTGREVAEACAGRLGKALLELGGKDPLIVDGVDPEWAADQAALGAFANAGQICTAVERIYVHQDIAEPFVAALTRRARELRVGPGTDPETEMGPLIDEDQRVWVHRHVEDAVHAGAELLAGGEIPDGPGFFYPPTVLVGAAPDAPVLCQETFGPVAAVRVVPSFDAALAEAAAGEYGLAATVLTPSHEHAQRAWRELEVGTVKVNAVFGGAPGGAAEPRRHSGMGFGYGPELLDEMTHTKVVHLAPCPPAG
ncbi:MAG TPA: aldehyde dehydrogenase family protein [Solirubrobacteraceae bacterium]|jgi:succinate-semialdehyde dehydrogenase/glutarate-semialdehyde dehydrogenase|nr:aldehyde dehydrogenase family protein [Solirubrobacteraceae bacterium]